MLLRRLSAILGSALILAGSLMLVPDAQAQRSKAQIGYVYPAGGKQGTTFEAVIAGQFLEGASNVHVSGGGVQATITELIRPINGRELNNLRIQVDELMARKAVVTNDFAALERFRSFKNAKEVKNDSAESDKQVEELKKKYANATWTAEDEATLRETRRKISTAVRRPANRAISEVAVVEVAVAPDAKPGQREIRVSTPSTLSNPLVFQVGQLPEFSEQPSKIIAQTNSAIARSTRAPNRRKVEPDTEVALPATINGQILPGEVDRYRFHAAKGQRLVAVAEARQLIPYIADAVPGWFQATLALYDGRGKELAYEDDFRFDPDPVLYCEIPADGDYILEIKDAIYRGREDFVYRIHLGQLPFVTGIFPLGGQTGTRPTVTLAGWNMPVDQLSVDNTRRSPGIYPLSLSTRQGVSCRLSFAVDSLPECLEKEPNDDQPSAERVAIPVTVNGRVDRPGDCDAFCFEGRSGSPIVVEIHARRLNSPLDSLLKLTDATGRQLAVNDDYEDRGAGLITHHADSRLSVTLPADGLYYVHVRDQQHKGGPDYAYRLRIGPPEPDFQLRVVPSSVSARAGTSVPLTVHVLRKDGFAGEIALGLADPPAGFALGGGRVPGDQDQVQITLTLPPSSSQEPASLRLEGRATIQGREVSRPVVPAEDMIQAFEYRHLVPAQQLQVAVTGRALRATVKILGETPVKITPGGTARVQLGGTPGLLAKAQFALSDAPQGITLKSASPSASGIELVLQSDAASTKPGLKGNLIVTASPKRAAAPAKRKAGGRQRAPVATLPAIPFEVAAPSP